MSFGANGTAETDSHADVEPDSLYPLEWYYAQQGSPHMLYEEPANEFVRDFVGKTLLFRGTVEIANPAGQIAIRIHGAPDCVVFGRSYQPEGLPAGTSVFLGIRPEDVDIVAAEGSEAPAGMIGATVLDALYIGERIEYRIKVDGQREIVIYGNRHNRFSDGSKIWLRPRADGHSAWPSDRSENKLTHE